MKPVVIIIPSKDTDKITLTVDELKKYLDEAYSAGYTEGYNLNLKPYIYPYTPVTYRDTTGSPIITCEDIAKTTTNAKTNQYITIDLPKNTLNEIPFIGENTTRSSTKFSKQVVDDLFSRVDKLLGE